MPYLDTDLVRLKFKNLNQEMDRIRNPGWSTNLPVGPGLVGNPTNEVAAILLLLRCVLVKVMPLNNRPVKNRYIITILVVVLQVYKINNYIAKAVLRISRAPEIRSNDDISMTGQPGVSPAQKQVHILVRKLN